MVNSKDKNILKDSARLRSHAEAMLRAKTSEESSPRTQEDLQRLVHELEVFQIELEMQNAELRRAREELELSRNIYAELYEYAPVGYFTFDEAGLIKNVNLAGARMLGIERQLLADKPFVGFIADAVERDVFLNHLAMVVQRRVMLKCEINLTGDDGTVIYGQLQSVMVSSENNDNHIFTSITDATVRNNLEKELQNSHVKLEFTVNERTQELTGANMQLRQEIENRNNAEKSLQDAYAEIKHLKDRLQAENIYLQQEIAQQSNFGEIIGQCKVISHVFSQI